MDRSLRRRGQFLVAVGALLGAMVGIVLGLAVEDAQTSTAVAAPAGGRAAALAVMPPSDQPTAAQPNGSRGQADGAPSTGNQRTQSAYRPDQGPGRAHKDSNGKQKKDNVEPRKRASGKPGKDNGGKGSDK